MDPAAPSWEQHLAASLSHFPAAGAAAGTGEVPVLRQICSQPKTYPQQGGRGAVPSGLPPWQGDCTKLSVLLGMGDESQCCSGVCLKRPSPAISSQVAPPRCRISHLSAWQLPLPAPTCWQGALGRQGCRQGFRQQPCCWQNPGHTVHPGHPRGPGSFWAFLYRRVCCVSPAHLGFSVFTLPLSPTDPPGSKGGAHRMPCDPVPFQAGSVTGMSPQTPPMRGHAGTRTCRPGTAQPCSWLQGLLQVPLTP